MKLSIILLDWGVRESFHVLQYLGEQQEKDFEIVWVDWHPRENPPELARRIDLAVDQYLCLNKPKRRIYHKHIMYNAGILAAKGEIICVMDSDAIVTPGFTAEIIKWTRPGTVLHLDEVRSQNRDLYPFNHPTIEEIKAPPSNWTGTTTKGMAAKHDQYHLRNYGACMAAHRNSLVMIGGADEHEEYRGHICGPYEMTFRLRNFGFKEFWHPTEFLYHSWHPGQDGKNNPMGPHDGRNMSVRAMMLLQNGRIHPWQENAKMAQTREMMMEQFCRQSL